MIIDDNINKTNEIIAISNTILLTNDFKQAKIILMHIN